MSSTSPFFTDHRTPWTLAVLAAGVVLAPSPGLAQTTDEALEAEQRALEEADAEAQAEAEEREESQHPRAWKKFFYVQGNFGYSYVDLRALRFENLTPEEFAITGSGWTTGAAMGLRLFLLTLGGRFSWSRYDQFSLGAVMGDIGLRVPNDVAEPYLRVGLGYGFMNEEFEELQSNPRIDGFMAEVGMGFDFWLHEYVTLGLAIDLGFYLLARDAIESCLGDGCTDFDPTEEGDSTAIQARIALQLGVVL